jgi:hypothetical protein
VALPDKRSMASSAAAVARAQAPGLADGFAGERSARGAGFEPVKESERGGPPGDAGAGSTMSRPPHTKGITP